MALRERGVLQASAQPTWPEAASGRLALSVIQAMTDVALFLLDRIGVIVADDLGISPRAVEIHRANLMTKMQARSLSELVRMSLLARPASRL